MPIKLDLWDYNRFHKSIPHVSNYPVISNVQVSLLGLVTWTTDIPSTSQVLYGTIPYLGLSTTYDSTLVTSHSVQIPNVASGTTYYFKVQSFYLDALSISDLYVFVSPVIPGSTYPAFILVSPNLTRWAISVTVNGNLESQAAVTGPTGAFEPSTIVLVDTNSVYWALTIDDTGHLITTAGGSPAGALNEIRLYDLNVRFWIVTTSITGNLTTT